MVRNSAPVLLLFAVAAVTTFLPAQTALPEHKREHFQNAEVFYGRAQDNRGERLRTVITRPNNVTGKVPTILIGGWSSCYPVAYPGAGTTHGFGVLLRCPISDFAFR